jgi:cysteinyl-tRNA synthetase
MVRIAGAENLGVSTESIEPGEYWDRFQTAMDDDFNTAQGIGILFEMIRNVNRILDEAEGGLSAEKIQVVQSAYSDLKHMGKILGILNMSSEAYFELKKQRGLKEVSVDADWVEKMISERADARKTKNWQRADEIRQELEKKNILLEDRPDGTIWKVG